MNGERPFEPEDAEAHELLERLWCEPLLKAAALPEVTQGSALVAEARAGYVASAWAEALPEAIRVVALDPSRAMLDVARSRLPEALSGRLFFVPQAVEKLSYADGVFHAAVCLEGLHTAEQAERALTELARVVQPGGAVRISAPSSSSFSACYDMVHEALLAHDLEASASRLRELRQALITPEALYRMARELGLHDLEVSRQRWEVRFNSGAELVSSPLIRQTFLTHWIGSIRASEREPVMRYVIDALDTYFHNRPLLLDVEAATLRCAR